VLRTIAIAASRTAKTHPVQIYGLDFSGGGLATLESLPTVGSIIGGADTERVARLIAELTSRAEERTVRYSAARAANLSEYRAGDGRHSNHEGEPRILVLVDGMAAFRTDYEFQNAGQLFDRFLKLVATGRQVGIHFVLTGDRLAAFPSALMANIPVKIVLRLAGQTEYAVLGAADDVLLDAPPGRALVGAHEVQFSVLGASANLASQADATQALASRLLSEGVDPAPQVERLAELIPSASLPAEVEGLPTIGVSDDSLKPVGIPLDGLFVITGPFGSGRSTAMTTAIRSIRRARPALRPHLIVARRSALLGATDWAAASQDSDGADQLAVRLAEQMEAPAAIRDTAVLIVIENVGDFEGLPAEASVARLLKAARRAEVTVIVEADTVTAASAWQIFTELKTARAGLVLQPEETDGISLFRVQFPRVTRADFPRGRGILVTAGRLQRVQVAQSSSNDHARE